MAATRVSRAVQRVARPAASPHTTEAPPVPATRWAGVVRPYRGEDVERLKNTVKIEYTLADLGARRLWDLLTRRDYVNALGALTGNQAVQQVKAGLEAIYLSGWQVAADANLAGQTYPDQSLYPANSVPSVVRRINQALLRADQIEHSEAGKMCAHERTLERQWKRKRPPGRALLARADRGRRGGRLWRDRSTRSSS